jgi:iron(III) transport system permease protein
VAEATLGAARTVRPRLGRDDIALRAALVLLGLLFAVAIVLPLYALLSKSVQDKDGGFVGFANFERYFSTPALFNSIQNSLTIALISTAITILIAFVYAYALTRTRMPFRGLFRGIALVPILCPSLLPGIAFVYLFGNKGMLKWMMGEASIYGPIGIVMGEVFWTIPHALIILTTALALSDARLYEASEALGASKLRTFVVVTLSGCRYGLISAAFVVFTLVITDFGVPKVIGGQYNVLATDIYKQVIGQQNFSMGAVVGLILLLPAALAFMADRYAQRRQVAQLSSRAVPFSPRPNRALEFAMLAFCALVGMLILGILATAAFASLVKQWPYDLSLSLRNYRFDLMDGGGWASYWNSLEMATWTAIAGTAVIFVGAYLVEKTRGVAGARAVVQFLAMMPMAVPGLVLGLAYIFFFNHPDNPLGFLYRTMAILVISSVVHFYTVAHLTAVTALKQIDPEFESVSASLKVPVWRTFGRVTVPVSLPAVFDISMYLFLNAMTTVSAVVFLYGPHTTLASVAVLNMDDAGDIAPAAAMGMMIVYTSAAVRVLHALITRGVLARTQRWRAR